MAEAAKITVTLEPEIGDFVREEVERNDFASASNYVEDLIRQRRKHDLARQKLDAELQKGIDDIEAGRTMPPRWRPSIASTKNSVGLTLHDEGCVFSASPAGPYRHRPISLRSKSGTRPQSYMEVVAHGLLGHREHTPCLRTCGTA